jgi:hypothetical protein
MQEVGYWREYGQRLLLGLMALAVVDALVLLVPSISFTWEEFGFINLILFVPVAMLLLIRKKTAPKEVSPRMQFILGSLWLTLGTGHGVAVLLGDDVSGVRIILAATNLFAGCLFLIQGWKQRVLLG